MSRKSWPGLLLVATTFVLLYATVFADLWRNWERDPNYSHGYLILPIVACLVWQQRDRLAIVQQRPSAWGLIVISISVIMLLVGTAGVEYFLMRLSMIGIVAGIVIYLFGWLMLRALAFPLVFSLTMIPLPAILFYQLAFPLQLLATRFGVALLRLSQVPVLREGNIIVLTSTTLEVAEACSGIRSVLSLLALAMLYGYMTETRFMRRAIIAASSIPIAIVANGFRVAGTGMAATYLGPEAAEGFFHTFSGWLVFVAAFLMMIVLARLLRAMPPLRGLRTQEVGA
jgi:exosortase A